MLIGKIIEMAHFFHFHRLAFRKAVLDQILHLRSERVVIQVPLQHLFVSCLGKFLDLLLHSLFFSQFFSFINRLGLCLILVGSKTLQICGSGTGAVARGNVILGHFNGLADNPAGTFTRLQL